LFQPPYDEGETFSGSTFTLGADLDLAGRNLCIWTPIGGKDFPGSKWPGAFHGTFDGAGHTISNMYVLVNSLVNSDLESVGLFGWITDGTVKNVNLIDFSVSVSSFAKDYFGTGGLVGDNGGTITNCTAKGKSITAASSSVYRSYKGGFAGILGSGTVWTGSCNETGVKPDIGYYGTIGPVENM
jgi:hypothetical protein